MKIGFYLQWNKGTLDPKAKNTVIGEEIMIEGFIKYMLMHSDITSAELFAPNHIPTEKLDIMIYMNDTRPNLDWADKHVVYFQNGYDEEGADNVMNRFYTYGFDGYIIYSHRLYERHIASGRTGVYMPYGVDLDFFHPVAADPAFAFDCAYIGNDIKGEERTIRYLCPALKFNLGLFGNWKYTKMNPVRYLKSLLGLKKYSGSRPYKKALSKISRGKIDPYDQPKVYSSSKIILNFTLQDAVDWNVMTLRTFEVLACKGFLISDRVPIAEKLLEDCVVFTDGSKDLEDKIHYYLAHPEERDRIAQNGYEYVIKYGSIQSRANEILDYIRTL